MNWGTKIIIAFAGFIGVIFTLAYISMGQDINLVSDDYYEQELAYEAQIQRIKNTQGLTEKPELTLDRAERKVLLRFPESLKEKVEEGKLQFYRPSSGAFDQSFAIALNEEGIQSFDVSGYLQGRWQAKITWEYKNIEYYQEINLTF